jgi:hypothetical protein
MKIKIEESKFHDFQLKRERILLPPALKSAGETKIQSTPSDTPDPEIQESTPKKKKEKKYAYTYSRTRTKMAYSKILNKVPRWKGAVIIFGDMGKQIKPLEVTHSADNLRETFSKRTRTLNQTQADLFTWMEGLLNSGEYKKLKIFITTSY